MKKLIKKVNTNITAFGAVNPICGCSCDVSDFDGYDDYAPNYNISHDPDMPLK
ncbi:hypothetical protein [Abyssisolibacter fermentans]|uniref:hypothetical protein n=1 Tax=Abyssisolibacter fermentans TaxID=1766203 RepID=UPI0012E3B38E|nr:hypothetical protein [Abyssisolibacter fermentans]